MRPALCRVAAGIGILALALLSQPVWSQDPAPKLVAETEALTPAQEKAGFHLPEGFEIQLVASEPEINKPMNLAFDARGRLWVTSTVEYPYPVKDGQKGRDRVVVLSDFDDSGKARKVVTFAEGLNIPIGLMPLGNGDSALIHDIPNIRRFTDTDGDGKADKVELAYEKYGFRDTHGMTNAFSWGFDGWIYACHGFSNESKVEGSDKKPILMQSGNVYRMKADGTHAEYVTHGQVNPFGLAFDALGNLYSCDCHSRPIYQLLRGAFYPSFGKPHDGLGFGPEMIGHDHGSTGIGGIVYYAANQFPESVQGNVVIGNVVTSRVNRDHLEWTGTSPKAVAETDFVKSDDPWFRPVDLELGPDGALYIADFYNRIIGHYEVPLTHPGRDRERGRIWRVVYKGKDGKAPPARTPRGDETQATLAELIEDLGHPNLAVRTVATNLLVEKGPETVAPLKAVLAKNEPGFRTIHALWALQRLGQLTDEMIKIAFKNGDEGVRIHAYKVVGERQAPGLDHGSSLLLEGEADASPRVRRAMAESMARFPSRQHLHALLHEAPRVAQGDGHFRHVIKVALRDQLLESSMWDYVLMRQWTDAEEAELAEVALGVPMSESSRFLLKYLQRRADAETKPRNLTTDETARFAQHIIRYGGPEAESQLVAYLKLDRFDPTARLVLLRAMHQGIQERGGSLGPEARKLAVEVVTTLIDSQNRSQAEAGIELAGLMKLTEATTSVSALASNPKAPLARRRSALTTFVALDPPASVVVLGKLLKDAAEPIEIREQAASLLNGLGKPETRALLVEALATAPARLQTAIATGLAQTKEGAEALLSAVASGKASARPLQERGVAVRLEGSGLADLKPRLEALLKDLPAADKRIQNLIETRRVGFQKGATADLARGAEVFARNCAACHQLEGKGARVGPQLDGVGVRGVERLLEDTLDPNRNVDQAFRVTTLALKDGRIVSGLLLRQDGEILVLADAQGKEVRISADQVEDRKLSQLSPMPANMDEQIAEADFYQLIAYLLSQRPR